nr:uncharacterized protein LOC122270272 [Parasteatoda tepidariorum]
MNYAFYSKFLLEQTTDIVELRKLRDSIGEISTSTPSRYYNELFNAAVSAIQTVESSKKKSTASTTMETSITETAEIPVTIPESSVTNQIETEPVSEYSVPNNITTPSSKDLNMEIDEETPASEPEIQNRNNKEPPAKKRKKKKKSAAATENVDPSMTQKSCTPSESLFNPEPTPITASEPTEETTNKATEPSTSVEKAQSVKNAKVLIRGLPDDFSTDEISLELGKRIIEILKIVQFKKKVGGAFRPLPLNLIVMPMLANHEMIYHIESIKQIPISIEKYHGGSWPLQCFRCQSFGHTQRSCTSSLRCMKCAEGHYSFQCRKSRDSLAKCCNCMQNHTSNFTGCDARPSRTRKTTKDKPTSTAHRLISLISELNDLLKDQDVLHLLTTLIQGNSPSN